MHIPNLALFMKGCTIDQVILEHLTEFTGQGVAEDGFVICYTPRIVKLLLEPLVDGRESYQPANRLTYGTDRPNRHGRA
jgi:hypothetical protein